MDPLAWDDPDADTDGDGLKDGDEFKSGTDPHLPDTDSDGLKDGEELSVGADPLQPDTDSDGLPDGWEHQYNMNPRGNNDDDEIDGNGAEADPDDDGLTNSQESDYGTNPNVGDTDGDLVPDGAEAAQGSDPLDPSDRDPRDTVAVSVTFGDPSGSDSEKYRLIVAPVSGDPRPVQMRVNHYYGLSETITLVLAKGAKYEVSLEHAATEPGFMAQYGFSNYDWELSIQSPQIFVLDPDHIVTKEIDWPNSTFKAAGKSASLFVLIVNNIEVLSSVALNSPQLFEGEKTDFGDPSLVDNPGQALIIFRDQVATPSGNSIDDFDISFTANVLPDSIPDNALAESYWEMVAGPSNGSFNPSSGTQVKFQNLYLGGLYRFEFDTGISGCPKSGANVLLPLAGADITAWLESQVAVARGWGAAFKATTMIANASQLSLITQYRTFRRFMRLSGQEFDYQLVPVSSDNTAPCARYNIPDSANRIYVTVNGVVVHGSKVNNLLWGVFGRSWGYNVFFLKGGAHANNYWERFQWDPQSSQNAIGLGSQLFDNPAAPLTSILTPTALRTMQGGPEEGLMDTQLWPALVPFDNARSTIRQPNLN